MYYRLKEPLAFRGWQKLPFAIRAMEGEKKQGKPILLTKETFLELLCCNGEEDVDLDELNVAGGGDGKDFAPAEEEPFPSWMIAHPCDELFWADDVRTCIGSWYNP